MTIDTSGILAIRMHLSKQSKAIERMIVRMVVTAVIDDLMNYFDPLNRLPKQTAEDMAHGTIMTGTTILTYLFADRDGLGVSDTWDTIGWDSVRDDIRSSLIQEEFEARGVVNEKYSDWIEGCVNRFMEMLDWYAEQARV